MSVLLSSVILTVYPFRQEAMFHSTRPHMPYSQTTGQGNPWDLTWKYHSLGSQTPLSHFETHLVESTWDFPPTVRMFGPRILGILSPVTKLSSVLIVSWPYFSDIFGQFKLGGCFKRLYSFLPVFYFGPKHIMCSKLSYLKDTLLSWL